MNSKKCPKLGGQNLTSKGNVRKAMLAKDVNGIRNDAIDGLPNHGKIGRILEYLKSG